MFSISIFVVLCVSSFVCDGMCDDMYYNFNLKQHSMKFKLKCVIGVCGDMYHSQTNKGITKKNNNITSYLVKQLFNLILWLSARYWYHLT